MRAQSVKERKGSYNCEGFRFRGLCRGPSSLTFALSRLVLAHKSRQAESSETPDSLSDIAPCGQDCVVDDIIL